MDPGSGRSGVDLPVKRHIDLDGIEKTGQKSESIEAAGKRSGIDDPRPVRIVPACDSDAYHDRLTSVIDLKPNFC